MSSFFSVSRPMPGPQSLFGVEFLLCLHSDDPLHEQTNCLKIPLACWKPV